MYKRVFKYFFIDSLMEIAKGAEAIIEKKGNSIIKKRILKSYRLKEIDTKLRISRTKSEAKILRKLQKIIPVPKVIKISEFEIEMEHIEGKKLSEYLEKLDLEEISKQIGESIAKMHDLGIIHGDLTTSNMILSEKKVFFIDFGLAFHSQRIEDKAVDLHLLKQALEAKHYRIWQEVFKKIIEGYKTSKHFQEVIKRLEIVEKRGRYKHKS